MILEPGMIIEDLVDKRKWVVTDKGSWAGDGYATAVVTDVGKCAKWERIGRECQFEIDHDDIHPSVRARFIYYEDRDTSIDGSW